MKKLPDRAVYHWSLLSLASNWLTVHRAFHTRENHLAARSTGVDCNTPPPELPKTLIPDLNICMPFPFLDHWEALQDV